MKRIKSILALAAMMTCLSGKGYADDIFKGVRGPSNWQIDTRAGFSSNEKGLESITSTAIIKYWDGEDSGKWFFITIPYKSIRDAKGSSDGIGDITVGGGPRFKIGKANIMPYLSVTLPAGIIGNKRFDESIGANATYLYKDFDVDITFQHTFTGESKSGFNPPDETYFGIITGGKLTDEIRGGIGSTITIKSNGDYLNRIKTILRYSLSKRVHIELVGEKGITSKNIPLDYAVSAYVRWNL